MRAYVLITANGEIFGIYLNKENGEEALRRNKACIACYLEEYTIRDVPSSTGSESSRSQCSRNGEEE